MDLGNVTWGKASYSGGNGGACVEMAGTPDALVAVRDSKDPAGPSLSFTPPAWHSFLACARMVSCP